MKHSPVGIPYTKKQEYDSGYDYVFSNAEIVPQNQRPQRKLPLQVDNSKLEIPVLNVLGMNSIGVLSPRESWGLNSL